MLTPLVEGNPDDPSELKMKGELPFIRSTTPNEAMRGAFIMKVATWKM